MQFGMGGDSGRLAPIFMDQSEYAYLSDSAKSHVDDAVARLLSEAYATARKILTDNSRSLTRLSEALVEFETLSRADIDLAIGGRCGEIRKQREAEEKRKTAERKALAEPVSIPATTLAAAAVDSK